MIKDLKNKLLTIVPEDLYGDDEKVLKVGDLVTPFTLPLATGSEFDLESTLTRGPVILNFIKGTWCPYCQVHLANLRLWQDKIARQNHDKTVTIIVISNESMYAIREFLKRNPSSYIFACDEKDVAGKIFGLKLSPEEFLKPATFLIDQDRTIRAAHLGRRKKIDPNHFIR